MPYPIFEKWKSNKPTVNIFLRIPSGFIAELVSHTDLDAITLDLQHGLVELEHSLPMLQAINKEKFPDLILGNADRTSASPNLIDTALQCLGSGSYSLKHNEPFKGGYITRYFGQPAKNEHALQLEMSKVNYMDDSEKEYDGIRAEKIRGVLGKTLKSLSDILVES